MAYTYRLFNSIEETDLADWQRIVSACGDSIFMDPRFIAAVEAGMRRSCRFWHVIVYDESDIPVACGSLTAITIDLAHIASRGLPLILRRLPGGLSGLWNLRVLVCGLPVSAGQHNLALTSRGSRLQIFAAMDGVMSKLAAEKQMHAISFKEFGSNDLEWTSPLTTLGYRRMATPPMHCFTPCFQDFRQYRAALRSHYRYKINRSIRKVHKAGIEVSVLTDSEQIVKAYTPEVHDLYHQVVEKADVKFETLSIEFFHELTVRLRGQVDLVLLSQGSKVIAFGWCLEANSTYHLLFAGLDYQLNTDLDLYFNLMYAWLDRALTKRVSKIELGQTSSAFKTRLGCYSEPLYAFVKGLGPLMSLLVRFGGDLEPVPKPATRPCRVFKGDAVENYRTARHPMERAS